MTRPAEDPEEDDFPGGETPAADPEDSGPEGRPVDVEVDLDVEEFEAQGLDVDEEGVDEEGGDEEGGDEEGEGEQQEGDAPAEPKRRKSKKRGDLEEEPEPGDPETPIPTMETMVAALEWAFAGEENVTQELLERFAQHAIYLLETNRSINLTAITDPKEIAAKHFLDSWRVTRLVPLIAKKVLDLGTGAGFPGLPVGLAEPNLSMTVIDSTRKKIEFLKASIEKLGTRNVRAVWDRAEDYLTKERVDIVLVRAVSSVRENIRIVRKVRHSLHDMVMLKGNSWSREVRAAEREAERLGFKLDTVWEHELPEEMGQRAILVYRAPGGAGF